MPSGPLYRIGAPIPIVPRTKCDRCKKPAHALWLKNGQSLCADCRDRPAPDEAA